MWIAERDGLALTLAEVDASQKAGRQALSIFKGDLIEASLPDPGAEIRYTGWQSGAAVITDGGAAQVSRDLRTAQVTGALTALREAFAGQMSVSVGLEMYRAYRGIGGQMAVGLVENRLYIALPRSASRRVARLGLWTPIDRCEPAIHAALAQLAAVLRLADALAQACRGPETS